MILDDAVAKSVGGKFDDEYIAKKEKRDPRVQVQVAKKETMQCKD